MQDDFNLDEFENDKEEITNKDRFNNILSYIPFLNIRLLFIEKSWIKKINKNYNKQWIALFLLYIICFFIISIISFKLSFILTLIYFVSIIFFATKAYNDIYVEIELIEKLIAQFDSKNYKKNK